MLVEAKIPQLGDLVADVWVEERHRRELEVTQNPIEFGAPVSDHSFVRARKLSVMFGVSNTPLSPSSSFSSRDRIEEARQRLFEMQDTSTFLTVLTITGGSYDNCLLTGIGWLTDKNNPHSIIFELDLEEIVIAKTKLTTYQPLPADERTGKKTEPDNKRGAVSAQSREDANNKRNSTPDSSANADQLAKNAAAKAQAEKLAEADNRTYLKKLVDLL